jgi:hypothetical protein
LSALVAVLAVASLATSAFAHLAEVTTSVELADVKDGGQLKEAVQAAVEDVLHDAIAFTPTVVEPTGAQVVRRASLFAAARRRRGRRGDDARPEGGPARGRRVVADAGSGVIGSSALRVPPRARYAFSTPSRLTNAVIRGAARPAS